MIKLSAPQPTTDANKVSGPLDRSGTYSSVIRPTKTDKNVEAWKEWLSRAKDSFEEKWSGAKTEGQEGKLKHFKLIRTLGTGSFGRVMAVQFRPNKEYYAMKVLDKAKIIKLKQVDHVMNEKRILYSIRFPFIVRLALHFKDNANLYMVMEFVNGGEMFSHLRKSKRYTEEHARFYAGQVLLAFEYLHSLDIAYRDLKPENILIDSEGYLKVADFGFAKRFKGRTYTMCGTPEYLAPEIIKNKGYNKCVDWWAFGILIFEMVTGRPPFESSDPMRTYEKIVDGHVNYPAYMSTELRSLLKHLITADVTKRYGNLKDGVDDIKYHRWFGPIDWIALVQKRLSTPYTPKVKNTGDYSNFDEYKETPLNTSSVDKYTKEFADF